MPLYLLNYATTFHSPMEVLKGILYDEAHQDDCRTRFHPDTLSDIMEVKGEGPSLNALSLKQAVEPGGERRHHEDPISTHKQFSPGDTYGCR